MAHDNGLIVSEDGRTRCFWPGTLPDYLAYHDAEWGRPVTDDVRLFEKICLEGFQSGLSWLTILRKRENFRAGFAGFDFNKVARFDDSDVERLLADKCIVRHRGKIVSTINNAGRAIEMVEEFGSLARYFWSHEPGPEERPAKVDYATLTANPTTAVSTRISKDLKKRGLELRRPRPTDHMPSCRQRLAMLTLERPPASKRREGTRRGERGAQALTG